MYISIYNILIKSSPLTCHVVKSQYMSAIKNIYYCNFIEFNFTYLFENQLGIVLNFS